MLADHLMRGVKAGLVAGLVFGLFAAAVATPLVAFADGTNHAAAGGDHGHEVESGHHEAEGGHADGAGHHGAAVPTAVDGAVSVLAGGLWAVLLGGGVFGVGYYLLEPAIPGTGASKSYVLGAAGFVTVSGAPWLVLPPVAPGVEQSLPVETRLPLYGGMMVAGALACLLAGGAYNRLRASRGRAVAAGGAALPFGLLAVPAALAPTNAVDGALAPELRVGLTGLFVFGQLLLWGCLAATHARFRPTGPSAGDPSSRSDSSVGAD